MKDETLAYLVRISNVTRRDSSLVQGSGGNTSVKTSDGRYMYVKTSRTALKDITTEQGWRRLRLASVLAIIRDKEISRLSPAEREARVSALLNRSCEDEVKLKKPPSVESYFHSILGRCVIHLHPIAVGAYVCAKKGKAAIEKLFQRQKYPPVWAPYADSGYMLAKKISPLAERYKREYGKEPAVLFLEKHGLIVSADTPEAALQLVRKVMSICSSRLKQSRPPKSKPARPEDIAAYKDAIHRAVVKVMGRHAAIDYFLNDAIAAFLAGKDARKLLTDSAITAGELIYGRGPALWMENCDYQMLAKQLRSRLEKDQRPAAFLAPGVGLFVAGKQENIPVIAEATIAALSIRRFAGNFGGLKTLTRRQQQAVIQLESP